MGRQLQSPPVLGRVRSKEEIEQILVQEGIANLSIRLPIGCNLGCKYCYEPPLEKASNWMTFEEICSAIQQAMELGAKTISIVGNGEPLLYSQIFDLLNFINGLSVQTVLYTNNTLCTQIVTRRLFKIPNVVVVGKQNGLTAFVQESLTGSNTFRLIQNGLNNLKSAGFNQVMPSRLSLHSIICRQNLSEIPELWRSWRKQNIIPELQVFAPPAATNPNRKFYKRIQVNSQELASLFIQLLRIDEQEFGFTWDPVLSYPFPGGGGCNIIRTSVGVSPTGNYRICSCVDEPLENIRTKSLADFLKLPKVQKIRNYDYGSQCYGCRTIAYNLTGDRFSPDPIFEEFKEEIQKLI